LRNRKGRKEKRGKSRKREGRGKVFFFPAIFFPRIFLGGKPSFWDQDNTLSLAYGVKIRAQKQAKE